MKPGIASRFGPQRLLAGKAFLATTHMRYSLLFLVAAASLCLADGPPPQIPAVRTEHVEKRNGNGDIIAYVDTAYRGKERSLQRVRFKKKDGTGWGMWQTYYVGGKAVMQEQDEGGGKSQTISFLNDGTVCEMFRRHQDGSVEPVSSVELTKFVADQQQFTGHMGKVLDKISERLQTNSPEQVMQDLKTAVQQKQDGSDKK
jgi:hypothetical protein